MLGLALCLAIYGLGVGAIIVAAHALHDPDVAYTWRAYANDRKARPRHQ